jgi:hypothetical protein
MSVALADLNRAAAEGDDKTA